MPAAEALLEADGLERNLELADPPVVGDARLRVPFVVPAQGEILRVGPAVGNQSFALYAEWVDAELKRVGAVFVGVELNDKGIVGFSAKVAAEGRGDIFSRLGAVHDRIDIECVVIIRHPHFGLADGIRRIEGEELEEHARRIGRLPVGFVHHAVDHDRRGRFADVQRGKGSLAHGRLAKSHEQDDERRQDFHGPARYRLLAIGFQLAGRWQCEPIYFRGSPDGELINREGAKTRRNIAVITLTFII